MSLVSIDVIDFAQPSWRNGSVRWYSKSKVVGSRDRG